MKLKIPISPDDQKFKNLVLFIAQRSEGDKRFGAVKLNKLLFYCDFVAYQKFGKPMTGHTYQKLENGPAPRAMIPLLNEMVSAGEVAVAEHDYYGFRQKRVKALRDPDLGAFTADEVALITELLEEFAGQSAKDISLLSHRFRGWQLASDGEDVPYEAAAVRFVKPTKYEHVLTSGESEELRQLAQRG